MRKPRGETQVLPWLILIVVVFCATHLFSQMRIIDESVPMALILLGGAFMAWFSYYIVAELVFPLISEWAWKWRILCWCISCVTGLLLFGFAINYPGWEHELWIEVGTGVLLAGTLATLSVYVLRREAR